MPTTWVDFKELRARARIADVLSAYRLDLKVKGERATGFCPLPGHEGERKSPSFSVHLTKNLFNCFSCKRGGNAIDLVVLLEGLDPSNPMDVRKAALKLADLCGISDKPPRQGAKREVGARVETTKQNPATASSSSPPAPVDERNSDPATNSTLQVVVNPPLDFELQKLDPQHPYLRDRGFAPETIAYFGLGYCSRGMLAGRIAIPLHDPDCQLIGYGGRLVDDAAIDAEHPKYLFPGDRVKDGVRRVFAKSRFLYNGHRLAKPLSAAVVEGFSSVWWMHQHGIRQVVALMGSDGSDEQVRLIGEGVSDDGVVYVMTDGDAAGARGAEKFIPLVSLTRAVRYVKLADGRQPTDLSADELRMFFPFAC